MHITQVIIGTSECLRLLRGQVEGKKKALSTPFISSRHITPETKFYSSATFVTLKRYHNYRKLNCSRAFGAPQAPSRPSRILMGPFSLILFPSLDIIIGPFNLIVLPYLSILIGSLRPRVLPSLIINIGSSIWTESQVKNLSKY